MVRDLMITRRVRTSAEYPIVPGCILVGDADVKVLYANKGFVAALGRPLEELLGEGWLESVERAFLEEARAKWYGCIRARVRLDVTWRFRVHDGTYRWQHLRAEPSFHEDSGNVCWYLLGWTLTSNSGLERHCERA
jgi:PAS domain S-box-containing protein